MTANSTGFFCFPNVVASSGSKRNWTGWNARWSIGEKIDGSQISIRAIDRKLWKAAVRAALLKETDAKSAPAAAAGGDFACLPASVCDLITAYVPTLIIYNGKAEKNANTAFCDKASRVLESMASDDGLVRWNPKLTLHAECVQLPKHNVVVYDRVPKHYVIVYDIQDETGRYFWPNEMIAEAKRLDLEYVPFWWDNISANPKSDDPSAVAARFVDEIAAGTRTSVLGGTPEGLVLKHPRFRVGHNEDPAGRTVPDDDANAAGDDEHALKLKKVTTAFKERHKTKQPKPAIDPSKQTPLTIFIRWFASQFNTPARFQKGVQHLRDRENKPRPAGLTALHDSEYIRALEVELDADLLKEYRHLIDVYLLAEAVSIIRKWLKEWQYADLLKQKAAEAAASGEVPPAGAGGTPTSVADTKFDASTVDGRVKIAAQRSYVASPTATTAESVFAEVTPLLVAEVCKSARLELTAFLSDPAHA